MSELEAIQEILRKKAELQARLNLLPYEGTPEIKAVNGQKYLYTRKRIGSRVASTYIGKYSEELHQILLKNAADAKEIRKQLRKADKQLSALGYQEGDIPVRVMQNLDFARAHMKSNIYDQAVLEGVATSFPQTEEIIENGRVNGMTATDVQKILNLKHAWEFVLDPDIILLKSDYYMLSHIAKLVNEGLYFEAGRIRSVPVTIGGSTYVPTLPIESVVIEYIDRILNSGQDSIDIAISLCLYVMKTQIFIDGNKRASVIYANHYLISHGEGFLVIPEKYVSDFKKILVEFYEGENEKRIRNFLKTNCWKTF